MAILVIWSVISVVMLKFNAMPPEYLYLGASMMLAAQYIENGRS